MSTLLCFQKAFYLPSKAVHWLSRQQSTIIQIVLVQTRAYWQLLIFPKANKIGLDIIPGGKKYYIMWITQKHYLSSLAPLFYVSSQQIFSENIQIVNISALQALQSLNSYSTLFLQYGSSQTIGKQVSVTIFK
jgi:hypothetical protein